MSNSSNDIYKDEDVDMFYLVYRWVLLDEEGRGSLEVPAHPSISVLFVLFVPALVQVMVMVMVKDLIVLIVQSVLLIVHVFARFFHSLFGRFV